MCQSCWERYGSPAETSPAIERAVQLIAAIYKNEPAGGPLHVVLDDWNLNGPITMPDMADGEWCEETVEAVTELVPLLASMPVVERASALARYDGFVEGRKP